MNEFEVLNTTNEISGTFKITVDFEYTDIADETKDMTWEQVISFVEGNISNELGIDSLGGDYGYIDSQLKNVTLKNGNDHIEWTAI
tara:strand:- start:748 stop:1005 length:258 start_codon:yes stop_codon:yes gene_type:complete